MWIKLNYPLDKTKKHISFAVLRLTIPAAKPKTMTYYVLNVGLMSEVNMRRYARW